MNTAPSTGYDLPTNVKPGDRISLEDGAIYHVTASYKMSETQWVLEVDGLKQMIQCDPAVKIRVLRHS